MHARCTDVSIHAPVGGATAARASLHASWARFQSTPLWEGRPIRDSLRCRDLIVSIHAPVGGATRLVERQLARSAPVSIHAPVGGATVPSSHVHGAPPMFQSTPLWEGRPNGVGKPRCDNMFQSTPLWEGRPRDGRPNQPASGRFQSTPLWEGRPRVEPPPPTALRVVGFNPRPCGRGDPIVSLPSVVDRRFQSTPLWEGRPFPHFRSPPHDRRFNPRPCGRGDQARVRVDGEADRVSIHAPVGGATPVSVMGGGQRSWDAAPADPRLATGGVGAQASRR